MRNLSTASLRIILFATLFLALAACAAPVPTQPTSNPKPTATNPPPTATEVPTETPAPTDTPEPSPTPNPHPELLDNFEGIELVRGVDGTADVGFVTWSDGSPVAISLTQLTGDEARPDQPEGNTVLKLETDIAGGGWGGFTHAFSNPDATRWISQDWSSFEGISLWIWGNGTDSTLFVDILENRPANSTKDTAERFVYFFKDDFTGWKYMEIPFTEFSRKDIGNGAPNDGMALTQVHGYAVGVLRGANLGVVVNYVDDVILYGKAP